MRNYQRAIIRCPRPRLEPVKILEEWVNESEGGERKDEESFREHS